MAHALINIEGHDSAPWWEIPGIAGQGFYNTPTGEYLSVKDDEWMLDEALIEHGVDGTLIDSYLRVVRVLPEDTYVPHDYVLATLTTALWWNKALDVSWMEMDAAKIQPDLIKVTGAALAYIDDDHMAFGVVTPTDQYRIRADCVTHIFPHDLIPDPESSQEKKTRLIREAALRGCQVDG